MLVNAQFILGYVITHGLNINIQWNAISQSPRKILLPTELLESIYCLMFNPLGAIQQCLSYIKLMLIKIMLETVI